MSDVPASNSAGPPSPGGLSWVAGADDSLFGIDNLPYGVFSRADSASPPRVGVRIGDHVLDLTGLASAGLLASESRRDSGANAASQTASSLFETGSLNPFLAAGPTVWTATRTRVVSLLTAESTERAAVAPYLIPLGEVTVALPFSVGDYVDFYASEHHASNVGRIFRPGQDPLTPNWKHLPIGYHGRSGTVVPSGTPIVRPRGQRLVPTGAHADGAPAPAFGASLKLDIEAELGFVVGAASELGDPVSAADFPDHVFGVVGLNDWSARDLQAWEYVPLGPFLGKSFATTISAWVTPLEALAEAWVDLPEQDPTPLPYLAPGETKGLDIAVEIDINGTVVSRPPYAAMYWSPAQMLAHMTVNGASVRTGDLYASGTISGTTPEERGSFLELGWNGTEPFGVGDGEERAFLEDGDTVTLRYTAPAPNNRRIALGEVIGRIEEARES